MLTIKPCYSLTKMSLGQVNLSDCTFKEFLIVVCSRADRMDYFCFNIFEVSADTEYSGSKKKTVLLLKKQHSCSQIKTCFSGLQWNHNQFMQYAM